MLQEKQTILHTEPKYELAETELNRLTSELIEEKTKDIPADHRFVTVEVGVDEAYSNIARHIEQAVFREVFGDDDLRSEFKPYEASSRFFISLDRQKNRATGAIRAIENSPVGFETIRDISRPPFNAPEEQWLEDHNVSDLNKVWDIATLAVLREYRTGSTSLQLFRAVYKSAVENHNIEHFVAILDKKALGQLEDFFGVAFQRLAGLDGAPYHHSKWSQPVYGYLPDLYLIARHRMNTPLLGKAASKAAEILVMGSNDESLALQVKK